MEHEYESTPAVFDVEPAGREERKDPVPRVGMTLACGVYRSIEDLR